MVNKAALSVLGVIVLVSMGVGILIGMQLGGPTGNQTSDGGDGGGPTAIPDGGNQTPIPTAAPETSSTPESGTTEPDQQRTTVSLRRYDAGAIENEMERRINENRESRDLSALSTTGLTAKRVEWMARNHSIAMGEAGRAASTIDGRNTADRYRDRDLFGSCQFQKNGGGDTINAANAQFEINDVVYAGNYQNNTAIAETIVGGWFENQYINDPVLYENADIVGVGVDITESGDVYATVNVC